MKVALTIGINNYLTAPLAGCVQDARGWAAFFEDAGFDEVTTLTDREAKLARVTKEIRKMLSNAKAGDVLRVHFSGHGTRVPDIDGDEPDGFDEAWVLFDGIWLDDHIDEILTELPDGVDLAVINDSCHSGGSTRSTALLGGEHPYGVPRFMPYTAAVTGSVESMANSVRAIFSGSKPSARRRGGRASRAARAQEQMNHLLLAGAKPTEQAWDTTFDGQPWGAFSFHALSILRQHKGRMTWAELHTRLSGVLPAPAFPQTPQLEGPVARKMDRVAG